VTWTRLDDGFWSNPKIVAAGNEAAGVYARALAYCGNHLTEGHVPDQVMQFIAGKRKPINQLVDVGLVERNGTGYLIPDFLEFNPTKDEALAMKEKRAEAGRRGGIASGRTRQARAKATASASGEANA
jgi:hypothetical protein